MLPRYTKIPLYCTWKKFLRLFLILLFCFPVLHCCVGLYHSTSTTFDASYFPALLVYMLASYGSRVVDAVIMINDTKCYLWIFQVSVLDAVLVFNSYQYCSLRLKHRTEPTKISQLDLSSRLGKRYFGYNSRLISCASFALYQSFLKLKFYKNKGRA